MKKRNQNGGAIIDAEKVNFIFLKVRKSCIHNADGEGEKARGEIRLLGSIN